MSSLNTSPETWLGKLVWFFPRCPKGLPIGDTALYGIVIDSDGDGVYIIMHEGNRVHSWVADMELIEEW